MLNLLRDALKKNSLILKPDQEQQILQYLNLMLKWNDTYNITSITNPGEMVYLHIVDSLIIYPFLEGQHFLDVGTGAGLPGIPLAILNPTKEWVLLDKVSKKTHFLTQVVAELGLKNVRVVQSRCEDFHNARGFDSILSRAFGSLHLFAQSTEHLLAPLGVFLAMKGRYPEMEIQELGKDFKLIEAKRLEIKGMNIERHLIRLKRINCG